MTANVKVVMEALSRIGIREFSGKHSNSPSIIKWLRALIPHADNDEIDWCSAFTADVVRAALEIEKLPQISAAARSWLDYGFSTQEPKAGDIVVFWRESPTSWKGHVGIFIRHSPTSVWVLGGNQSNAVTIAPYDKNKVLGYRTHTQPT